MAENTTSVLEEVTANSAELDAVRRSPAAHLKQEMLNARVTGERSVSLEETAFVVQLGVRTRLGSDAAQKIEQQLGFKLPQKHGETTGDAKALHALWLGPDEFLVVDSSRVQIPGETEVFGGALEDNPGQVIDLSANRTMLTLAGTSALSVLEKGCQADLHPRSFPVGHAIVTQLGVVPVLLHRVEVNEYRLYPRASFADYVVRWVLDASQEFGSDLVE